MLDQAYTTYNSDNILTDYSDRYKAICIKSYIKAQDQDTITRTGPISLVRHAASEVKQDMKPKANLLVFVRDFLPGILLGFIHNLTMTGSALLAINKTLQDQASGVALSPGDFAKLHGGVIRTIEYIPTYFSNENGLLQEAKNLDETLEMAAEYLTRRDVDINLAANMADRLAAKVKRALRFVDYLERYKNQIVNKIKGKTEEQIIEMAQNETEKPVGIWAKIVNWVKNKVGRGKAYGIPGIRKGELDLFITNMGLSYHLAATSSTLLEKMAKTSIMNRNAADPRALAPDIFDSYMEEIVDTFELLEPENVATLDYVSIKTKIDALLGYASVYINILNDATVKTGFKIVQLRSICLLILNNLRDLIPICLKMDPLIAVTDI